MTDFDELVRSIVRDELAKAKQLLAPRESFVLRKEFRPRFLDGTDFLQPGMLYAVALIPELVPFRIKVGFTRKSIADRLRSFATCCPTAIAIGAWGAAEHDEDAVLLKLKGRIGNSEVFVVSDVEAMLVEIDRIMERE